jgi:hypothetical protein
VNLDDVVIVDGWLAVSQQVLQREIGVTPFSSASSADFPCRII